MHPVATPAPVRPTGGPAPAGGEMPCPNCGKTVQAGFAFCGACGTRIGAAASGPAGDASAAAHDVHGGHGRGGPGGRRRAGGSF